MSRAGDIVHGRARTGSPANGHFSSFPAQYLALACQIAKNQEFGNEGITRIRNAFFAEMIAQDLIYVDKTAYIYQMIKPSTTCCFLSRPRRFGKTLLLDTIRNIFMGHRHLFKGLWIYSPEIDYDFKTHPVIRFRMNYSRTDAPDKLERYIANDALDLARSLEVRIDSEFFDKMVEQLIVRLSEKHDAKAVILVGEYDAAVSRHIDNQSLAEANCHVLRDFYASLKNCVEHIRFAFVTGTTRYAFTALDYGPNNFYDLSLDPQFSGACGFTISEFDRLFSDELGDTLKILQDKRKMPSGSTADDLRSEILKWYDGYNWLGQERVLIPKRTQKLTYPRPNADDFIAYLP